ncbi:hypothetical protein AQUCO_01300884v1 [Aquilegia coerulea]|uniref:F-box domain-containing protein n=1 Tax=Aquilegia coerulea TaxID=218851 RepID=A0A2G5E413_AQUCA|nr:hypothetical protein AQUCO_01300884v1 [Aquilegia coerulea]
MATSDWSRLPSDILIDVAKHLNTTHFEFLQFRSVCPSWRSSAVPTPIFTTPMYTLPSIPVNNMEDSRPDSFTLLEESCRNVWLIRVQEAMPNHIHLTDPLSRTLICPLQNNPPNEFNLLDFKINGLCIAVQKVVLPSTATKNDFVVMALYSWSTLVFFRAGDEKWTVIEDQECQFLDLIHFQGQFYAVDSTGRACIVDPNTSNVTYIANSFQNGGGTKKHLVESKGELFLVNIYADYDDGTQIRYDDCGEPIPTDCKVFKLNERNEQWVQVENLGDVVFLVYNQCSYSISASDFPGCEGNLILLRSICL